LKVLAIGISRSLQGGVESILADLCCGLPERGIEMTLGLARGLRFDLPERYRAAFPDLPCIEIDGSLGTRRARIEAITALVNRLRPDIVFSARVFDALPALAALKAHSPKAPRLATTIQAYEAPYLVDAKLYRGFLDLVVTSGQLVKRAVVDWCGIDASRVVSIPGGVLPPRRERAERGGGPWRIGYVGRLDPDQKRILDLIPFVRRLKSAAVAFRLDVVGTGPAESELREALAEDVERGLVRFHGWQSTDALYECIYPELDLFVHFAHTEGITIAPREAMAHGVVPVVSDFAGRRIESQFVDGETARVFPVGDVEAAVTRTLELIANPDLYARLSRAARKSQQGINSHSGALDAWAAAFRECMARPPMREGLMPKLGRADSGRLARLGLDEVWAHRARKLLRRPVVHQDPGSEWPTASGRVTDRDRSELAEIARGLG
jgi:glycosyltransferase involved in cell wall biosynthesis